MTASTDQLVERIEQLKQERRAVLLVHNYQEAEVQAIADFLGDSLGLSRQAAATDAEVIVFCGVHFMAETAAILCPDKTVLIPDESAGCPMADMITAEQLRELKAQHPGVPVVAYVNTSAEVKAEADICCTSANAAKVVEALGAEEIIFVPDQYLGAWTQAHTETRFILWPGYCHVHRGILPEHVERLQEQRPEAVVLCHPECVPEVTELADHVMSTSGMVRFARETEAEELIVGTEVGLVEQLQRDHPEKRIHPASERAICPNMKKTTLEKVLWSLEEMQYVVTVPEDIRERALRAVKRMIEITE